MESRFFCSAETAGAAIPFLEAHAAHRFIFLHEEPERCSRKISAGRSLHKSHIIGQTFLNDSTGRSLPAFTEGIIDTISERKMTENAIKNNFKKETSIGIS